jgi:multidrug/hemolysin transport system permease protein
MIYRLVLRNLRLYFRDRASVFFSLLGVFVMIGLYALFLGNLWVDGYGSALERIGLGQYADRMRFLIDSWIIAGVTAAASITTTMGAFGTMIDDQAKHIVKDFKVAPIQRWQLVLGYILSSVIIGWMMSVLTLVLGEGYILLYGGQLLSLFGWLKVLGIITLSVFASSALVFLLIAFLKSPNAFGTASTLMGTLIGFFMGVYVAIGNLPSSVQWVVKCFPIAHTGVLLRKVMVGEAAQAVFGETDAVGTQFLQIFEEEMGVTFHFGSYTVPVWLHVMILVLTAILFFALTTILISRRKAKE